MPRRVKKPGAKGANKGTGWLEWRAGQYTGRFTLNGVRYTYKTNKTKKEDARAVLQDYIKEMSLPEEKRRLQIQGRIDDIDAELEELQNKRHDIPLVDIFTAFEGSHNRKSCGAGELKQYKCYITRFTDWMKERFPRVEVMRQVTADHANRFADVLSKDKTPATFNRHVMMLRSVWKVLKRQGKLPENPWEDIQKKDEVSQSRRELTVEELAKVCTSTEGEMRVLFALGIYTGQRLGDCAQLQWSSVDMVRGIISLMPSKTKRHGQKRVVIPIHPTLREILSETPAEKHNGYVIPGIAALYKRDAAAVSDKIGKVFRSCGIETSIKEKKGQRAKVIVGFHSLRHTFVSLTANAGASIGNVRSITGHATTDMALHYFHENEAGLKRTIAMLPAIENGKPVSVPVEGEFASILDGLDEAALKRLKKAVEARLVNFRAH